VAYTDDEFNARILKCIDEVLSSFGDSPRTLLYYMIIKECRLSREQFPLKPVELGECLGRILGETGYRFIERLTIRQIQASFGFSVKEGSNLSEAIDQARIRFVAC